MGYRGRTEKISCANAGYNANPNFDAVSSDAMVSPSKNVEIHEGGVGKRKGSAHVNTAAITNTPDVTGLYDYRYSNGTQVMVAGTNDGKLWSDVDNDGSRTAIKTGLTASSFYDFITYNEKIYITVYKSSTASTPQRWDGADTYTTDIGVPEPCTAALAGLGAGNVNNGSHSYKITFVTAQGETYGGTVSNQVTTTAGNGQVALTFIPTGASGIVTARKIYRTVAGDTGNYLLVATLADNTTTTYTDNIADGSLGAAAPSTNTAMTVPTDWTSNAWPKQMLVHGYGNSERVWCLVVPGKGNWIYITPNNDGASDIDFSQTNIITMYIETGDGFGLVGGVDFKDRMIVFGKRKAYIIDDADPNTDMWGYAEAAWEGGAAHHKLIVKTPNDLICMMEDGEIYSVTAAQEYGDYKLGSIARPYYMDKWIKDNLDLTKIDQFHGKYDRKLRAVRFWVVRSGQTECDTQLVYYIDRGKWAIEDNQSSASGCSAACSAEIRESVGSYNIYTGDYSGFVWKLNQSVKADNAQAYTATFQTPPLSFETEDDVGLARYDKMFRFGRFIGSVSGDYNINITAYTDGGADSSSATVNLSGSYDFIDKDFDIGLTGKRLALKFSNASASQDFFISAFSIDWKTLGAIG